MASSALVLISTCLVLTISYLIHSRLVQSPLAQFPGPKLWALTRLPYMLAYRNGTLAHRIRDFHTQYGEVIRVAPNELSFTRPDAVRDIYQKRPNDASYHCLPKDPVRQPLPRPGAPVSILEANDADHTRIRRGWAPSFSSASLAAQEPLVNGYISTLIAKLSALAKDDNNAPIDLQQWYSFATFDIITSLSFGRDLECTATGQYHAWVALLVHSIQARVQLAACRFYPALYSLLTHFVSEDAKAKQLQHMAFTRARVEERLAAPSSRPDFFANVLRADMSRAELVTNAATMVFAGSHTMQSALTGITLQLLKQPAALARVTHEVRAAFTADADISFRALQALPLLNAAVNEGLRLTAPVPLGLTRVVPAGGAEICGFALPAGTIVSYASWAAQTSPRNFSHATEFHPERFLQPAPAPFADDRRTASQPFLLGPRDCIGQNLARVELLLVLARVLFAFDVAPAEEGGALFDWEAQRTFAVWMVRPLLVRLRAVRAS